MKKCSKCGVEKDEADYYIHSGSSLMSTCKECYKKRRALYFVNNKEKIREYAVVYYKKNTAVIKERVKKWRQTHPRKKTERTRSRVDTKVYRAKYYLFNKVKCLERTKEWKHKNKEHVQNYVNRWRKINKGAHSEHTKRWYNKNPEKARILAKINNKKYISNLTGWYIKNRLTQNGFTNDSITPDLINLKRTLIKIKRELCQTKKQSQQT